VIAFGPVPSRRLGRSLGVNNIPMKHCTYSCVYCQVGATGPTELDRRTFHSPRDVVASVEQRLQALRERGESADYITFVPDGEPTLDAHLGDEIGALTSFGIPVAVITNGSLLWSEEVRADLSAAAVVSLKVDTVDEPTWRRLNRPCRRLGLDRVLSGMIEFSRSYAGMLLTETMLVAGVNDDRAAMCAVSDLIRELDPACAYVAVPTRPPALSWVEPPDEGVVVQAHACLAEHLPCVEWLVAEEEGTFARTGDATADLLGILAVHPLREEEARAYLTEAGCEPDLLDRLVSVGRITKVRYRNRSFVTRRFPRRQESA
jgi:wyosine [tRNA(Phe)-imidazoG37] synthetase (radical SAM superfamily)